MQAGGLESSCFVVLPFPELRIDLSNVNGWHSGIPISTCRGAPSSFATALSHLASAASTRSPSPSSWCPPPPGPPPPRRRPDPAPMDRSELARVFQLFDRNGDGRITTAELTDSLRNLGIHIADAELEAMIEKVDTDGDGCVDVEEFGVLYKAIMEEDKGEEEEEIREAFEVFDKNGDGFISAEELRAVLSSLGLKQGRTAEDCRQMISQVDLDGDGMVDFKEFKRMIKGQGGFAALG